MREEVHISPVLGVRRNGDAVIADVVGDVNLNCGSEFQKSLLSLLNGPGKAPSCILVNLSQVGYIDSSGVASLVKLLAKAKHAGVPLWLVGLNERVRSVFEITRLDRIFQIAASEKEALG
ncbi:MAG: STAS domain-containing protein [Phycisphaerae bacterium]|jgi:anti-sigma B factor antagonist